MAEVIVLSSSIVRTKKINKSDHTKIHLTPYDLKLLHFAYPQRGLLFPKPDDETRIIHRLKASLSIALEIYFPFAGRLVKVNNHEDNTLSFYIDCDSSGARFVHAKVESVSANDFLQPYDSVPDFKRCFFPANDLKSSDGVSEPLLALQVTEIKDGVFISFGYNHMVADGSSFWNFFHTWSKICMNGSSSDTHPLVLKDWFLDKVDYPIHMPVLETGRPPRCKIPTKERVFHFTKTNISDLKAEANADITFTNMKISSLQAVLAHLWISIIKHSGLNREEDTHCIVAADMRRRLNPPLKKECFGNVTHQAIATAKVGEILDHGLGWAALQINKQVRTLTNENYKAFAENWVRNIKFPKISGGISIKADTYLIATSSPWFEVYDNDFGWGKPIAVRAEPGNGIGISLVVFRGLEEGSIDVNATIPLSMWSDVLVNLLTDV
ncbi:Transferase [Arabidopsis thaliana x Arabidopsis arenosa]|uniref:Transferase n=1 Tax=Arabidopsis thaliana x Arabidopsis arenosa TaxID=1240361 RepID=A0A8T1YCS0_9BRAS|nr:Transferase [Arabidopsis thaliana x Arabidopsis arenosa]